MNRFFTETTICKDNEIEIVCNLPYEVKYEDPEMKDYNEQNPASGAVASVNGQTGVVVLDKASVGLGNVDNTSDADKPISTATQAALDGK
ncbi:MAG: hypothetical protein J6V36_04795, partial [Clostridia bacterium]|nr:hypothetical protein [Clostridia bacterium]